MDAKYYPALLHKLLDGKLSAEETSDLIDWLARDRIDLDTSAIILARLQQSVDEERISPEVRQRLEAKLPLILNEVPVRNQGRIFKLKIFRYAAALIIICGLGLGFWLSTRPGVKVPQRTAATKSIPATDFSPGTEGAILTLADGSTVVLDSLGNGMVATQNGAKVLLQNGKLVYQSKNIRGNALAYNTITTPAGRQFQLVLPDGTKVWLNAASSLRYPIAFTGKERKVEITGEAYFEVTKNPQLPFTVKINNSSTVEVLGTHFNINSYANEGIVKTTLIEGKVKVVNHKSQVVISPGQQAQFSPSGNNVNQQIAVMDHVNLDKVMAWKNGVFDFQDASLEEVMRQLERWYDIDVVYEQKVPQLEFIGRMGRDLKLSDVLRGLEMSEVHFRIEGERKLVVIP